MINAAEIGQAVLELGKIQNATRPIFGERARVDFFFIDHIAQGCFIPIAGIFVVVAIKFTFFVSIVSLFCFPGRIPIALGDQQVAFINF